jgi:hypothetical protein
MFRVSFPKRRSLAVTVVAEDRCTLHSIGHYLNRHLTFFAVPTLEDAFTKSAASDAVVFYPDRFPNAAVQRFIRRLIGNATLSLVIIVTAHPERFVGLDYLRVAMNKFIVLSEPAWPWELLATIHSTLPGFRRLDSSPC